LNTAAADLASAMVAFSGQIKTDGTKSGGYTAAELTTRINFAKAAKEGIVSSADGTDVNSNVLWVTPAALTAFNNAITAAEGATDANRDAQYNALNAAINTFNAAKSYGTRTSANGGSITFTGIGSQYNGQYASFRSSGSTEPTGGGDYLLGGNISSAGITGVQISNGSVTVPVQLVDSYTRTGGPYNGSDKNIRIYLNIKSSPSFAFEDLWSGDYEKYTINSVNFTNGNASVSLSSSGGEQLYGALTVNGGLFGDFAVFIVTGNITDSNIANLMENPVAVGEAESSPAYIEWYSGAGSGTYGVIIASAADFSVKYQNGVTFTNGNGSVNWNNMTVASVVDLSVGNLTFAGGSPGWEWTILIVNGPLTGTWEDLNAMDAYVAVAPSYTNGMIFTVGATGGTFNPNGTYSIIYVGDNGMKYGNNVSFSNGNAAINLSSLSNFGDGPVPVPSNSVTITGLSAYVGYPIQVGLFQTPPTSNDRDPPIYGTAFIQNDWATVSLYNNKDYSPWNGTGYWYVSFMIGADENSMVAAYVAYNSVYFSAADPNLIVDISSCRQVEGETGGTDDPDKPGEPDYPPVGGSGELVISNGILTLTGFDVFNDKYVYPVLITSSGNSLMGLIGAEYNSGNPIVSMARVRGGTAVAPLYISRYDMNSVAPSLADIFIPYESSETIQTVSIMIIDDADGKYTANDSGLTFLLNRVGSIVSNPMNDNFAENITFGNFTINRSDAMTSDEIYAAVGSTGNLSLMYSVKYILEISQ
jgi:hypothetical protein